VSGVRRTRLLRLVLPALLVPFVAGVLWQIRSRPALRATPPSERPRVGARAEEVKFTELWGPVRRLSFKARFVQQDERGGLRLEGIEPMEVEREDGPPLLVRAATGSVEGPSGRRRLRLGGGVELLDEGSRLRLHIPALELDEAAAQVRSSGQVVIETARWKGRADSVVYGLKGAPTEFFGVAVEDRSGGRIRASRAVSRDRGRDVELVGAVRADTEGAELAAESLRLFRPDGDRLRRAVAEGAVSGSFRPFRDSQFRFGASLLEVEWDDSGRPWRLALRDRAHVEQGERRLAAPRIEAHAAPPGVGYEIEAEGGVRAEDRSGSRPALVLAERLRARLGDKGNLEVAEAAGSVRLEGIEESAEAVRARFEFAPEGVRTTLEGEGLARARWSRQRLRLSAERILADGAGETVHAEGGVAATVLPGKTGGGKTRASRLFSDREAVHFLAAELDASNSLARLVFSGDVRGWQADRNLSADRVELDQDTDTLVASGDVRLRLPRRGSRASGESGFFQVSSERLDYRGGEARAVFEGSVRSQQSEGWLEASRMEVKIRDDGPGDLEEIRASGAVRFEFRSRPGSEKPTLVTGEGDRAVYDPSAGVLDLYGERSPASIRGVGQTAGTVAGRRLRYRMSDGSLEVDSGEADRVRGSSGGVRR